MLMSRSDLSPRRLRVLVLDEEFPWPLDSGKRLRSWHLLSRLARRHEVHLVAFGAANEAGCRVLELAGIHTHPVPPSRPLSPAHLYLHLLASLLSPLPYSVIKHRQPAFAARVRQLCRDGGESSAGFDLVHCEWTPYAVYAAEFAALPWLIATHNLEQEIWRRRAQLARWPWQRAFLQLQARRMARFERAVFAQASGLTAVSERDARFIGEQTNSPVWTVANGVDFERFTPPATPPSGPPHLLYLGSLDWQPNIDAVEQLLDSIFPLIRQRFPDAVLDVVGRRPSPALRRRIAASPGVVLHGGAGDVRPYLAGARAILIPLRAGGGTRIKILEAMAAGCPVVSSRIGAEGLAVADERHLLLAESPAEFAHAVARLLNEPSLAVHLTQAARRLVVADYGWAQLSDQLEVAWLKTVAACGPRFEVLAGRDFRPAKSA